MNRRFCLSIGFAASIGLLLTSGSVRAVSITLVNPSFELDVLDNPVDPQDGSYTFTAPPGWTSDGTLNSRGTQNPVEAQYTSAGDASGTLGVPLGGDGRQSLFSAGAGGGHGGYFTQVTGATLEAGHTYELTVAVGQQLDRPAQDLFYIGMYTPGFANLLSVNAGTGAELTAGRFVDISTSFTANEAQAGLGLMVYVEGKNGAAENLIRTTGFDNVRLTAVAPVPEPSTLVLLTTCVLGQLAAALRRR